MQNQQDTPASRKPAPKKALNYARGSIDLQAVLGDGDTSAKPLVKSTPETDKHNTVLETPKQRNPSEEQILPRIDRDPTDASILKFLRIALPQVQLAAITPKPSKLFGAQNGSGIHEITPDGLLVRGRTLAGPRAAAVTSD